MELGEKLSELAGSLVAKPEHFLVDVAVSGNKTQKKVRVVIDGDKGVTIEDCALLSRALSAKIEEMNLIPENFTLEVTTPGIDSPLKMKRQYAKNIGRDLRLTLEDKTQLVGKLVDLSETHIQVETVSKDDKKKKQLKKTEIPFSSIVKALVQISFK